MAQVSSDSIKRKPNFVVPYQYFVCRRGPTYRSHGAVLRALCVALWALNKTVLPKTLQATIGVPHQYTSYMPEGHVIHRLAHDLNRQFQDTALSVTSPQGRFAAEAALLDGHELAAASAWGKQLFIAFDTPHPESIIYIHLGLIGTFRFEDPESEQGKIRLHIANDTIAANLRGPQWCRLITAEQQTAALAKLGADPLRADADPTAIFARVQRSQQPIGALLMDQHLFAGVGNIYRAETLFRLHINPFTPGKQITQLPEIWDDLVVLMRDGVHAGRIDTVRPEHTPEAMGRAPRKDDHGGEVYVYRRAGLPCYICGTPIEQTVLQGRNLFWCPTCQPALP